MRAVILQPMYLPWMGYFGMIDVADVFVFFDDVQYVERSWQRRNRIKMPPGQELMLSVPTQKSHRPPIHDVLIHADQDWAPKHWQCIRHAYSKTPGWKDASPALEEIYARRWEKLLDLDVELIRAQCRLLGLPSDKFVFSSALPGEGARTDRLLSLLKAIGADEYVSGPAAKVYVEREKFKAAGVQLYWFEYRHPTYPQVNGGFIPYMSAIDVLFNAGPGALDCVRQGLEGALVLDPETAR